MSEQRSDDFTHHLGFMQLAKVSVLLAVVGRRLDLNDLACQELANRGLDHHGTWVGFPAALAIYERTRRAAPDAAAREEMPTNTIEMTITGTIVVDDQRHPMNQRERDRTERALRSAVRETLSRAYLFYAQSYVKNVTVFFSGYVAE